MIELRNGSVAESGFAAIPEFDERSLAYGIVSAPVAKKKSLISSMYECPVVMSQIGGSCVGYSLVTNLLCTPNQGDPEVFNSKFARKKVYFYAQRIDQWPGGEYPGANPKMQGTSLLAGLKALKTKGIIRGYNWSFSNRQLKIGIGYNKPATIAIKWFTGMNKTNKNGHIAPYGTYVGFHAITVVGYDAENDRFRLQNTWGPEYGENGQAWLKGKHMKALLAQEGQAVFLKKKKFNYEVPK